MSDANKKARRPVGYKPFWEDEEEEKVEPAPPVEEEKPEKWKMISGLMRQGIGPVIGKKKK